MATATTTKERSVIFRPAAMLRAVLDGRKTQGRWPLKSQPIPDERRAGGWWLPVGGGTYASNQRRRDVHQKADGALVESSEYLEPLASWLLEFSPCRVGDVLWVREVWCLPDPTDRRTICYRASGHPVTTGEPWRPSATMPRWASRLTLEVVGVRAERVRDITPADALAEGIELPIPAGAKGEPNFPADFAAWDEAKRERWIKETARSIYFARCADGDNHVQAYASGWDELHGAGAWDRNDWVWVVEFRRIKSEKQ